MNKSLLTAMSDLKAGRITPDEYRAVVRASKAQHGQAGHERMQHLAIATANRKGF
jgi:hypothetical protein